MMEVVLDWISGICWTMVYLLAIYLGVRKKTYYIPAFCICLNISWEMWVVFARIVQGAPLSSGFISQILWLLCDAGVFITWLLYATDRSLLKKCMIFGGSALVIAILTLGFGFWAETAFLMNLFMSVSFLFGTDKQIESSLTIAILKSVGTLSATILNGVFYHKGGLLLIGGLCFIADALFIYVIACNKLRLKHQ